MSTYYINEAVFALPDRGFVDRTVHALEAPLPDGDAIGLLVLRRPIAEHKTLRDLVKEHVDDDAKRLSGFTVLEQADSTVAGAPAIVVRSRWRHSGRALYQCQAHAAVNWTWLLFAVTGPLLERVACDEAFESILSTLVWRDG
jgi:hypothetical protein